MISQRRQGLRALLMAASAAAFGPAVAPAWPQTAASYPDKPIRLLVPFPPGGAADRVARTLMKNLEETMKATFVIENKGGVNGSIAHNVVVEFSDTLGADMKLLGMFAKEPGLKSDWPLRNGDIS